MTCAPRRKAAFIGDVPGRLSRLSLLTTPRPGHRAGQRSAGRSATGRPRHQRSGPIGMIAKLTNAPGCGNPWGREEQQLVGGAQDDVFLQPQLEPVSERLEQAEGAGLGRDRARPSIGNQKISGFVSVTGAGSPRQLGQLISFTIAAGTGVVRTWFGLGICLWRFVPARYPLHQHVPEDSEGAQPDKRHERAGGSWRVLAVC